ncbi:MAG: hypothetical protein PHD54_02840 [Desulfuromonadaceae bacterium]|nr:hypothetical protein [Desulfuromonadaceae bacterium]
MRKILMVFALSFLMTSTLYAAETAGQKENSRITQEIGRYQLFQGTFTTLDLKYRQASSTHNAVFLLDTATGLVKRYVNRIDEDGKYIETWLPTDIIQQMVIKKPQVEGK